MPVSRIKLYYSFDTIMTQKYFYINLTTATYSNSVPLGTQTFEWTSNSEAFIWLTEEMVDLAQFTDNDGHHFSLVKKTCKADWR